MCQRKTKCISSRLLPSREILPWQCSDETPCSAGSHPKGLHSPHRLCRHRRVRAQSPRLCSRWSSTHAASDARRRRRRRRWWHEVGSGYAARPPAGRVLVCVRGMGERRQPYATLLPAGPMVNSARGDVGSRLRQPCQTQQHFGGASPHPLRVPAPGMQRVGMREPTTRPTRPAALLAHSSLADHAAFTRRGFGGGRAHTTSGVEAAANTAPLDDSTRRRLPRPPKPCGPLCLRVLPRHNLKLHIM